MGNFVAHVFKLTPLVSFLEELDLFKGKLPVGGNLPVEIWQWDLAVLLQGSSYNPLKIGFCH